MPCAVFKNMTEKGMWLSEIQVTGYKNGWAQDFEDNYGTGSMFMARKLSPNGIVLATYVWDEYFEPDYCGGGEWGGDAHWKNLDTDARVQGKNLETDVWLDVGESLWFTAPEFFDTLEGDGYHFANNGEVLQGAQTVPLCNDGTSMVGNPLPIDVWMSETTVIGYHDSTDDEAIEEWSNNYGTGSDFMVRILNPNGVILATYVWDEYFEPDYAGGGEWGGDAHWKNLDTDARVQGKTPETDYKIESGSGLWFTAPNYWGSEGNFLTFPKAL